MRADQAGASRGGRALMAAAVAWVVYRFAKRAVKVALLAGIVVAAAGLAQHRGVDLSGAQRFATCEVPALIRGAAELPQLLAPATPAARARPSRLARELARCQAAKGGRR